MRRRILAAVFALGASAALAQSINPYRIQRNQDGTLGQAPTVVGQAPVVTAPTDTVAAGALPGLPGGAVFILDPESGVTRDAGTGKVTQVVSAVNGYTFEPHGSGATAGMAATLNATGLAGRPAFATTGQYYGLTTVNATALTKLFGAAAQPMTLCTAFTLADYAPANNFTALWNYNPGGSPGGRFVWSQIASNGQGPQLTFDANNTSYVDLRLDQIAFNSTHVACFITDGATLYGAMDGGTLQSASAGGQIGGMPPAADAQFGVGTTFPGLIGTTVAYDRVLSAADYTALLNAYNARYGTPHPVQTGLPAPDPQGTFLTTPNVPKNGTPASPLPTSTAVTLPSGLSFEAGAVQVVGMRFGTATPNANITTGQQVRDNFFTTTMEGNKNAAIGSPMDTGQSSNNTFAAVARTYSVGDPNDLIPVVADSVAIRAACSQSRTDCRPGHVYGGLLNLSQVEIRPGMTVKVRYRSPKGDHSWAPIWLFSITQQPPKTAGVTNFYDSSAEGHSCGDGSVTGSGNCMEIDINDNFSRFGRGTPTGKQIDFGTPDIYGAAWEAGKAPRFTYGATGNGFTTQVGAGPDYIVTDLDWSAAFHDLILDWRPDGNMNLFVDNALVSSAYQDFTKSVYYTKGGVNVPVGMQLMLQNQAIPSFAPGASSTNSGIQDNDGLGTDGWTLAVQEVGIWQGNIANPTAARATTTSAY